MEQHATETFRLLEKVTVRKYRGEARGRPYAELVDGDDLHRASGQWNHLRRELDREADTYDEVVTAPDGTVIHECREPLSEHRGHGAAKRRGP